MATWNSRGLRGSALEEFINQTCEQYRERNLALIQKSTVDYIGVVQGIPVCFDAKECHTDNFPLQNIHEHQVRFMGEFEKQDGIAFLILYFSHRDEIYYMRYEEMLKFWNRGQNGGRKHFKYEELNPKWFLTRNGNYLVPFLEGIALDLKER